MRRWLAILLLVLLPTQMSWAVLADYCAHPSGAAADHVGHHDHAAHGHGAMAEAAGDAGGLDAAGSPPDAGVDCDHCHGHCAGMLLAPLSAPSGPAAASPEPAAAAPGAAPMPAQPERPQWARLA